MVKTITIRGGGLRLSAVGPIRPSPCLFVLVLTGVAPFHDLCRSGSGLLWHLYGGQIPTPPFWFSVLIHDQVRVSGSPTTFLVFGGQESLVGGFVVGLWWFCRFLVVLGGSVGLPDVLLRKEPDLAGAGDLPFLQGLPRKSLTRKAWLWVSFFPELVSVMYFVFSMCVLSAFFAIGVGSDWCNFLLLISTTVGSGWCKLYLIGLFDLSNLFYEEGSNRDPLPVQGGTL